MQAERGETFLRIVRPICTHVFSFSGELHSGKSYAANVLEKYLRTVYPEKKIVQIACADILKRICAFLNGWPESDGYGDEAKKRMVYRIGMRNTTFCYNLAGAANIISDVFPRNPTTLDADLRAIGMTRDELEWALARGLTRLFRNPVVDPPMTFGRLLQLFGTEIMRNEIGPEIFATLVYLQARQAGADILIVPDARFPEELKLVQLMNGHSVRIIRSAEDAETDGRSMVHASETALKDRKMDILLNPMTPAFDAHVIAWASQMIGK